MIDICSVTASSVNRWDFKALEVGYAKNVFISASLTQHLYVFVFM